MEYVNDRGWFADPPIDRLLEDFRVTYPKLWEKGASATEAAQVEFTPDR
jgi:hypothetical protein